MKSVFQDVIENGTSPFNAEVSIAKHRQIEIKAELVIESAKTVVVLYHVTFKGQHQITTALLSDALKLADEIFRSYCNY